MDIQLVNSANADRFLVGMGLENLTPEEKQKALDAIIGTLNVSVGERIADNLSEEQLDQFEQLQRTGGDEAAEEWLRSSLPNLNQIIGEEAIKLRNEAIGDLKTARSVNG